jgi:hypothetical protein
MDFSPQANYNDSVTAMASEVVPTFSDRGCCCMISAADPYGGYSHFSKPEPLLSISSSSSVILRRPSGPHSRPTTSQKI